jgi:transcriptional regulator with XRE-family HTH domain
MEYSQIILGFMASKGVTAYKLSNATTIAESTFSGWKKKPTSKIQADMIVKIAEYFNVSTDYLLGLVDEPSPIHLEHPVNQYYDISLEAYEVARAYDAVSFDSQNTIRNSLKLPEVKKGTGNAKKAI